MTVEGVSVQTLVLLLNTGVLTGIFLRLGGLGADMRNVRERVGKLEEAAKEAVLC